MKKLSFLSMIVIFFASCATTDLVVESVTPNPNWAAGRHTVDVKIKNIGNKPITDQFYLYIEAHNSSTTQGQISSQATKTYTGLASGAVDVITVNFDVNPFVAGHTIADVIKIYAVVDAKKTVREKNESNNEKTVRVQ